jgi:hypothetical protein
MWWPTFVRLKPLTQENLPLVKKNYLVLFPPDDRASWHHIPERFYFLFDLYKLLPCTLRVMNGLGFMEGLGPRYGTAVDYYYG